MTIPDNFIAEYKRITLTPKERSVVRSRLRAFALSNRPMNGFFSQAVGWVGRHSIAALVGGLVIAGSATGVSAQFADPGDALYDFRVAVNDRIETSLIRDDEQRLDVEMEHMQRMIDDEDGVRDQGLASDTEEDETEDIKDQSDDSTDENLENELDDLNEHLNLEDGSRTELEE
ncbi:MAG: hypothetical protein KBC02_04185 [Candidatus Pacebacteria bacterium]|nr:hypothetical protein [Candidatus Paceibacterota bacterium]